MHFLSLVQPVLFLLSISSRPVSSFFWPPLEEDMTDKIEVQGNNDNEILQALFWADSYSVGDHCFCESTFDHRIGEKIVDDTPLGEGATVRDICDYLGPGPGFSWFHPRYNDIQCGNGPPNDDAILDEITCPGRIEYGPEGCGYIGPKWNFDLEGQPKSIFTQFFDWFFGLFSP